LDKSSCPDGTKKDANGCTVCKTCEDVECEGLKVCNELSLKCQCPADTPEGANEDTCRCDHGLNSETEVCCDAAPTNCPSGTKIASNGCTICKTCDDITCPNERVCNTTTVKCECPPNKPTLCGSVCCDNGCDETGKACKKLDCTNAGDIGKACITKDGKNGVCYNKECYYESCPTGKNLYAYIYKLADGSEAEIVNCCASNPSGFIDVLGGTPVGPEICCSAEEPIIALKLEFFLENGSVEGREYGCFKGTTVPVYKASSGRHLEYAYCPNGVSEEWECNPDNPSECVRECY
jgi:hypothetical protein